MFFPLRFSIQNVLLYVSVGASVQYLLVRSKSTSLFGDGLTDDDARAALRIAVGSTSLALTLWVTAGERRERELLTMLTEGREEAANGRRDEEEELSSLGTNIIWYSRSSITIVRAYLILVFLSGP